MRRKNVVKRQLSKMFGGGTKVLDRWGMCYFMGHRLYGCALHAMNLRKMYYPMYKGILKGVILSGISGKWVLSFAKIVIKIIPIICK